MAGEQQSQPFSFSAVSEKDERTGGEHEQAATESEASEDDTVSLEPQATDRPFSVWRDTNKYLPRKETAKAVGAFARYCAMGLGRSLPRLQVELAAEGTPIPLTTLKQWSVAHKWQERVREYDLGVAEERRKKREEELEKMNERHALLGVTQQQRALKLIDELVARRKFGPYATVQLLKLATDLERLARGANTEQSRVEIAGDESAPLVITTRWDRALTQLPGGTQISELDDDERAALLPEGIEGEDGDA